MANETAAPSSGETASRKPVRIGMLTPSSNTVLEPMTARIFEAYGDKASVHFARFRVIEISMSKGSKAQFDLAPILAAAELLADAKVDVIAWNGTSSAWLGLDTDETLCTAIEDATGIAATTTMIAYDRLFTAAGIERIGLVTPYLDEIQERIVDNYRKRGIEVVGERHLNDRGNFSFAGYEPKTVERMVDEVAATGPQMIAVVCTNFRGGPVAEALEARHGIPVVDSVSITAWATACLAGLDPARVEGWGRLFRDYRDIEGLRPTSASAR